MLASLAINGFVWNIKCTREGLFLIQRRPRPGSLFTMATKLSSGGVLHVHLTAGITIAFKSERLEGLSANEGRAHTSYLDLYLHCYSIKKDIVVCILVRRGHSKVFFNDRAQEPSGWLGRNKKVDLRLVDVERWQHSGSRFRSTIVQRIPKSDIHFFFRFNHYILLRQTSSWACANGEELRQSRCAVVTDQR